jgi:hypothetical protein
MKSKSARALVIGLTLFGSRGAWALSSFNPADLTDLTSQAAEDLIKLGAVGGDHHAYMPAGPLGLAVGLDVSFDATVIRLPDSVQDAMRLATDSGTVPGQIFLPKLNIRKGLPAGIDVGFSYLAYQQYKIIGAELQWAFLRGKVAAPNVAVRWSENWLNLFFMNTRTHKFDVVASKKLGFVFEPYVGAGMQFISGSLDVPLGSLPASVSGSHSSSAVHFFGGFPFRLIFLRITAEYDYSLSGIQTYGFKAGISL